MSKLAPEFRVYMTSKTLSDKFMISIERQDVTADIDKLNQLGYFHPRQPVVFITHGFWDDGDCANVNDIKDGLLALDNITAVIVVWFKGARMFPFQYHQAASKTQTVGEAIATLAKSISNLVKFKSKGWVFTKYNLSG